MNIDEQIAEAEAKLQELKQRKLDEMEEKIGETRSFKLFNETYVVRDKSLCVWLDRAKHTRLTVQAPEFYDKLEIPVPESNKVWSFSFSYAKDCNHATVLVYHMGTAQEACDALIEEIRETSSMFSTFMHKYTRTKG